MSHKAFWKALMEGMEGPEAGEPGGEGGLVEQVPDGLGMGC